MGRSEFLKRCQKASDGHGGHLVSYDGTVYIPHGYEMTFRAGKPQHRAILRDLSANSLIYVELERVENNE